MKLMDRLERDDVLIVTKLDRLGRNAMDATVANWPTWACGLTASPSAGPTSPAPQTG
jgi:hypothetical protein